MRLSIIVCFVCVTDFYCKGQSFIEGIRKLQRVANLTNVRISDPDFGAKRRTKTVYDFVVIGSSPGGSVVTNRLTENPTVSVLLIEAGIEDNVITDVPVLNPFTVLTDYNWKFLVDYDPRVCRGMEGGVCPWPAGKGTGGGTILNAMIYTRGIRRDYDSWAAEGLAGWSYDEILPYFLKAENTLIPQLRQSKYHGNNGPLPISYSPYQTPLLRAFIDAGVELGFREIDYNNPNTPAGFGRIQATMRMGERASAATAYLRTIVNRPNFEITLRSRATKILIDRNTRKAFGVVYVENGKERVVYARKEVILAAGAFNTPQLLMLSGIGHAEHLHEMDIPLVQDLPVGDNLMEHYGMHGLTFLINETVSIVPPRIIADIFEVIPQYVFGQRGVATSLGCEAISFLQTKYANNSEGWPDIELLFVASSFASDGGLAFRKTFGVSDTLYDSTYRPIDQKDSFSIWPMLLYPKSRGYVRLRDNNPLSKVRIVGNYVADDNDINTLIEAIKIAIKLSKTEPFQRFGAKLYTVPFPNCADIEFGSDAYWECAIRTITTQFHHQSGTCRMGTVVDSRLKVLGVEGLRVVDISVMPTITAGHTQAPAYMIGEKAADLIKEDWKI
ncbi:hypothetical protein O3M35_006857 [Rhynocoris fuscipes]|uniref:Glucose-methanol-choline oxidoreductase N-terminal domain-containing protein n=1 Tax=Rhynocoris fuscipes TaxID=488301 RepID=A0AAW1DF02_9HEMI